MPDWNERGHVLATCDGQNVYCRVVGIGNMNNCAPFQDFSMHMQERGYSQFILDFSTCDGLDSTFLGILLGLAVGRGAAPVKVVVLNASESVRRILHEVGIDQLLEVCRDAVLDQRTQLLGRDLHITSEIPTRRSSSTETASGSPRSCTISCRTARSLPPMGARCICPWSRRATRPC